MGEPRRRVIERHVAVQSTARVKQMQSLFDVSPEKRNSRRWDVDLDLPDEWNVGLILGPSGAGKTTIANELFPDAMVPQWTWSQRKSILDDFPKDLGIKDIVQLLSSVGFSSPPSWVRPFRVLSTGEQFRVTLARTLAEMRELSVMDEFTSVVGRDVAKVGSAAVAKTVRRRGQRFVAISCHYDIVPWLQPDWTYEPHTDTFQRRRLRRPSISLDVQRVSAEAWSLFEQHHYLSTALAHAARCFVAFWDRTPVAFSAVMHFPHARVRIYKREHRTVCLPDFQGVGIGNALSDHMGAMCRGMSFRYISLTSHPGMIAARKRSRHWRMRRQPELRFNKRGRTSSIAAGKKVFQVNLRAMASFEYLGPSMSRAEARALWNGTASREQA